MITEKDGDLEGEKTETTSVDGKPVKKEGGDTKKGVKEHLAGERSTSPSFLLAAGQLGVYVRGLFVLG